MEDAASYRYPPHWPEIKALFTSVEELVGMPPSGMGVEIFPRPTSSPRNQRHYRRVGTRIYFEFQKGQTLWAIVGNKGRILDRVHSGGPFNLEPALCWLGWRGQPPANRCRNASLPLGSVTMTETLTRVSTIPGGR